MLYEYKLVVMIIEKQREFLESTHFQRQLPVEASPRTNTATNRNLTTANLYIMYQRINLLA
jgi:hypothetical protein